MSDTHLPKDSTEDGPVTVIVTRAVRPGRENDYETWLNRLLTDVGQTIDGYLGTEIHRPSQGSNEYTSVFRFASLNHLRSFETSDLRARYLEEVAELVEADAVWNRQTGLEFWFSPPPGTVVAQPSRFRMAILLTIVVYLLVLGIGTVGQIVIGEAVPNAARLFIVIAFEVALMTYMVMPFLTRRLAGWIYPSTTTVGSRAGSMRQIGGPQ